MRIAYFGLPLGALLLLADGHEIVSAFMSRRDTPGLRRLVGQLGRSVVRHRSELEGDDSLASAMRALEPDLVVSWFWTTRLPMTVVAAARLGGIGTHPSLLPRYRGPDPYFAAIDAGDEETGVSVHRIEAAYDTGAILAVRKLRIDPEWTAWQLARRLDRPSLAAMRDVVARLGRGEELAALEQDESLATLAPEPTDEECVLRWSWPTERLLRRVRALSPAPGAFTVIDGREVTILRAQRVETGTYPLALFPGEAVASSGLGYGLAIVRTGDGAVALLAGEIEGEPADAKALATLVSGARKVIG